MKKKVKAEATAMMLISPLIKMRYIQSASLNASVLGSPFDFPLDLDDSDVPFARKEMTLVCDYLNSYRNNKSTLANYTKEMEKFLQWLWRIKCKALLKLNRRDALEYLDFIIAPPYHWIARGGSHAKYVHGAPNPKWRPFTSRSGEFEQSNHSIRGTLNAINSLFMYLIEQEYTQINPFLTIKNPIESACSNLKAVNDGVLGNRREALLISAQAMASENPGKHERTFFIIQLLAYMDLKVTDLAPNNKCPPPVMNNFFEEYGQWRFRCSTALKTKILDVPPVIIRALTIYRKSLSLENISISDDHSFLLPSLRSDGQGYVQSSKQIRKIISQVEQYKPLQC